MPAKLKFEIDEALPPEAAALYLEIVASGLRKRLLEMRSGETWIEFPLPPEIAFEPLMKLDARHGEARVEIRLKWR